MLKNVVLFVIECVMCRSSSDALAYTEFSISTALTFRPG